MRCIVEVPFLSPWHQAGLLASPRQPISRNIHTTPMKRHVVFGESRETNFCGWMSLCMRWAIPESTGVRHLDFIFAKSSEKILSGDPSLYIKQKHGRTVRLLGSNADDCLFVVGDSFIECIKKNLVWRPITVDNPVGWCAATLPGTVPVLATTALPMGFFDWLAPFPWRVMFCRCPDWLNPLFSTVVF